MVVICDGADEVAGVIVEAAAAALNCRGKEVAAETMMAGEVVLWLVQ